MEEKRNYSDEELLDRIWAVEEIKKLVYTRAIYIANEWRQRELDELWVSCEDTKQTASFGRNTGWYVGMDAITEYYVHKHYRDRMTQLEALHAEDLTIEVCEENLHMGCSCAHTPTTGLVRIAEDGKTARAMFYSCAHETEARPDGTACALWAPEKQAFDFIREADCWKIWHAVIATDIICEAGDDFGDHSPYADEDLKQVYEEFGTPTVPCLSHDSTFNWWDDYPPVPDPYETFTEKTSYGPEGYQKPKYFAWAAREGGVEK